MQGDYAGMYALLSPASQAAIDAEGFATRYRSALEAATVLTVTARPLAALEEGEQGWASFRLELDTALVGKLLTDTVMSLSRHGEQWLVDWDAGLIWPQLAGDLYFRMDYSIPVRANIYDRDGLGLAANGKIVTVGVIPGQIEDEPTLLAALATVTGLPQEEIYSRYANMPAEWKVPITDVPAEVSIQYNDLLSSVPGIYRDEKDGRVYPHGDAAPHVVGWVSPVPAEQLAAYRARGYRGDEWVGVAGLEAWGEPILAGEHGGTLRVITAAGEPIATVAEQAAVPSRAIYTTLIRGFQEQVQHILGGRKGAIVVLDVHTGAVLAMASGPGFDLNIFGGPGGAVGRQQVLADPRHPLINRAIHGTYPCGSVFKIVTIAAALESAGMDPDQTVFHCPGYWDGLGVSYRKRCWKAEGHGDITLKDALTASCDVTFYAVGQALDELDPTILPRFAKEFGFGALTGLDALTEDAGQVPDPQWKVNTIGQPWWVGDSVNLAIGQGYLLVTPLQVARMMAAVANGGTLYAPYVVGRIAPSADGGIPEVVTQPRAVGQLPVSQAHLAAIQEALLGVTTKSIGTAPHRFAGLSIPVAGKTGTAESGGPETMPHSWFAAYAPADAPEIAIAVVVEQAGEGSSVAAPLTRQVVEAYYGLALSPLPPQAQEGYATPTPEPQPET
jgi:penicillin-binding protein 2